MYFRCVLHPLIQMHVSADDYTCIWPPHGFHHKVDVQFKPTTTQGFHLTPYLSQFEKATSYAGFRKFSAWGVGNGWNGLAFFGNVNFNINNSLIFPASEGLHCKPAPLCDGYPLIWNHCPLEMTIESWLIFWYGYIHNCLYTLSYL